MSAPRDAGVGWAPPPAADVPPGRPETVGLTRGLVFLLCSAALASLHILAGTLLRRIYDAAADTLAQHALADLAGFAVAAVVWLRTCTGPRAVPKGGRDAMQWGLVILLVLVVVLLSRFAVRGLFEAPLVVLVVALVMVASLPLQKAHAPLPPGTRRSGTIVAATVLLVLFSIIYVSCFELLTL